MRAPITRLEVFVEERSAEAALGVLIPKIVPGIHVDFHNFGGKQSLLKRLGPRMNGYSRFLSKDHHLLVLVDRDNDDCIELKSRMEHGARASGLFTKSEPAPDGTYQVTNRILIQELEAWFFGDWEGVRAAYSKVPKNIPSKKEFRDSDDITGTWEAFERILKKAGYFRTGLRKPEAAQKISAHMEPARNQSRSFQALLQALVALSGK